MSMPSRTKRGKGPIALLACAIALGMLAGAPSGEATTAHAAKISAKATCAKLSPAGVGGAIGVPVKRPQVRDNLALPVGDGSLGFECGFYPAHPTDSIPSDETVALVDFSRTRGTAAKLRRLIHSNPTYPGFKESALKGLGTVAYLTIQPFGESSAVAELPEVVVWVLKGHTIFYAYSKEVAQPAVEKLAKLVAGRV